MTSANAKWVLQHALCQIVMQAVHKIGRTLVPKCLKMLWFDVIGFFHFSPNFINLKCSVMLKLLVTIFQFQDLWRIKKKL